MPDVIRDPRPSSREKKFGILYSEEKDKFVLYDKGLHELTNIARYLLTGVEVEVDWSTETPLDKPVKIKGFPLITHMVKLKSAQFDVGIDKYVKALKLDHEVQGSALKYIYDQANTEGTDLNKHFTKAWDDTPHGSLM